LQALLSALCLTIATTGGKVSKDVEPGDWLIMAGGYYHDVKTVNVKEGKTAKLIYGKDGKLK